MKRLTLIISLLSLFTSAYCQGVYEVVTSLKNINIDDTFIIYGKQKSVVSTNAMYGDQSGNFMAVSELYSSQVNGNQIYIHREQNQKSTPAEFKLVPVGSETSLYMLKLAQEDKYLYNNESSNYLVKEDYNTANNANGYWSLAESSYKGVCMKNKKNSKQYIYCYKEKFGAYENTTSQNTLGVLCRKITDAVAVKISSSVNYTATALPSDADFTTGNVGLTAFIVSDVSSNSVTLKEVDKAASGEGVVLFDNKQKKMFYPIYPSTQSLTPHDDNLLKTSTVEVVGDEKTIYALGNKSNGVGFYKVRKGVPVPLTKPYLKITNSALNSKDYIGFAEADDEDVVTGIRNNSNAESRQPVWYNLKGQKVSKPHKGIFVCNGKKIVVE